MFLYIILVRTNMPSAFVLLNTELGSEDAIVRDLKSLEGVNEVFQVYGVYDIIAKVESDTMDKVKEIITWKLRKLTGVKSTLTMIVME
jgi:DNA-binding Lrp family transcriptional regulator